MTAICTLKVISGPTAGESVEVDRELIIGRRDADLTIPDEELSRHHAAVRPAASGVVVEDLESLNGTFVAGERISGPVELTADASIRVGRSEIHLLVRVAPAEPEEQDEPGRTRLAGAVPPEAIPQPQMTRIRQAPGAAEPEPQSAEPEPPEPRPIPQPQATRVRATPIAPDASAPPDDAEQAKPPHGLKRLIGRILGRARGGT